MTHLKKMIHPVKTGRGLAHALASQAHTEHIYPSGGITKEQFDMWAAEVLASREPSLHKDSLASNITFIRKSLWGESPIHCLVCKTEMKRVKFQNDNQIDVYQCPNCLHWIKYDEWYSMHLEGITIEKKQWYGKRG
jgi:hypothetical protein